MRATIPVSNPSDPAGLAAPAEAERRRPGFLGGLPIPLADGQDWAFAGPREVAAAGPADRAAVADLLRGIDEADDHADRLRGELALAIHLLGLNYDLSPADYARLLTGTPTDPWFAPLQSYFHDLARRHAEALGPRPEATAGDQGRRFRFPMFRPHRRVAREAGRSKTA